MHCDVLMQRPINSGSSSVLTDLKAAVIWSCATLIHLILYVQYKHSLVWHIQSSSKLAYWKPRGNEAYMGPNVSDYITSHTGYQIDSFNGMQSAAQTSSQSITPPHAPKPSFISEFLSNLSRTLSPSHSVTWCGHKFLSSCCASIW